MKDLQLTLITWTDLPYQQAVSKLMAAIDRDQMAEPVGEVIFKELQSVKVHYNLETGHITILPVEKSPFIKVHFAKKAFPFMIAFVKDAICLVAKKHLLIYLYTLDDEDISYCIREYHGEKDKLHHLTLVHVDSTLNAIANCIKPIFTIPFFQWGQRSNNPIMQIVAEELQKIGIHHIRSQAHVKKIKDAIQERLNTKMTKKQILMR